MIPLHIACQVDGAVELRTPLALDALLGAALAQRRGLLPPGPGEAPTPLDIPLARSGCRRMYLASFSIYEFEAYDLRWRNRRFPVLEAQGMGGPKLRRINASLGPTKTKRVPREAQHLRDDRLDWYAVGTEAAVRDLLGDLEHVGASRGVGSGRVRSWSVQAVDPWEPGFPLVLDGRPLRPLPVEWPGVRESDCRIEMRTLEPPYWWEPSRRAVRCWVAA